MTEERAWIAVVAATGSGDRLAQVYSEIGTDSADISNILAVQSLDPDALAAHYKLYRGLMFGPSPLTRSQRESIAVVVSLANNCHY